MMVMVMVMMSTVMGLDMMMISLLAAAHINALVRSTVAIAAVKVVTVELGWLTVMMTTILLAGLAKVTLSRATVMTLLLVEQKLDCVVDQSALTLGHDCLLLLFLFASRRAWCCLGVNWQGAQLRRQYYYNII